MSNNNEDDDPVVASYNVFVNPRLPPHQKIHILHQSVRYDEGSTPAFPRIPTELRVKPDSGVLEVDVPLDMMDNYDRDKGMQYGRALKETVEAKGGGSHGLAGGFGIGAPAGLGRKAAAERDRRNGEWVDEVRADRVLKNQTLGGIVPKQEPLNYMIGVFQGGKLSNLPLWTFYSDRCQVANPRSGDLHLTPANAFVNLNPQLHHVDAATQLEKAAPASGSKDAAPPPSTAPTRAIHMTIKNANDPDSVVTETMADRLRAVQAEPWRRMRFVDENDGEAWDVFSNTFVPLREVKEPAEDEEGDPKSMDADLEAVQWLETPWDVNDIEKRISGKAEGDPEQQQKSEAPADGVRVKAEPGAAPSGGRAASRATGSGVRRGRSTAMEID